MYKLLKRSLIYSAIGRYGNFIITLLVNMILSRILTPNQYGQVTAVQIFIVFFQLMSSSGIGIAIVQRRGIDKKDIESIFSYSIILSIILAAIFPLVGVVVDYFYGGHIYFGIAQAFSIAVLFYGLVVVPNAVLTKDLKFSIINLIQIVTITAGAIVGVVTALNDFGPYSIVLMTIMSSFLDFLLKMYFSKIKPGSLNFGSLRKILDFTYNILISDTLKYFSQNLDNILVGKYFGDAALGNYGKAYQLLKYPNYLISGVFVSVLGPVLAEKKEDIKYLKKFYIQISLVLAYIAFPISAFFIVNAQDIIELLFGPQWQSAVMPFRILSVSVWVQILFSVVGPMFEIRDTTKSWKILTQINTSIMIVLIVIGIMFGSLESLAVAVSLGFIITYMISVKFLAKHVFRDRYLKLLVYLVKPILLFFIALVALIVVQKLVTISSEIIYLFLSGIVMIVVSYIYILLSGDMKKIMNIMKERSV